jgi:hypothetical protein
MNSRTFFLIFLMFLTLNISNIFSQTQQPPKTIYELFHLKPGGCRILSSDKMQIDVLMEVESMSDEKRETVRNDLSPILVDYRPLFNRPAELTAIYQKKEAMAVFNNENYIFKENDLYGLKNAQNYPIIRAKFNAIIPDEKNGFVAYENQFCNYYSMTGQKLLKSDYYFIKRTPKNTFIVQNKAGYGVILSNNNFIISPGFLDIDFVSKDKIMFYWLQKTEDSGFYLSENAKDTIQLNDKGMLQILDADHWIYAGRLINIKTKKFLICELEYFIEIVSPELHLAKISDSKTRLKYLIDFDGNLITNQPFKDIYGFDKKIVGIGVIKDEKGKSRYYNDLYGIIDSKGKWLINPAYRSLYYINDSLIIARDKNDLCGIINAKSNIAIPFKYKDFNKINESHVLGVISKDGEINSEVIRLSDRKIIKTGLHYTRLYSTELCNGTIYLATEKKNECALNGNFEPVCPCYERIFYESDKNSLIGTNFSQNGIVTESHYFDCKGNRRSFTIQGKSYNNFMSYNRISPDLEHVLISSDTGYFITSKGKVVENNGHWQSIEYSNSKDLFKTMKYGGKYGIINSEGETVLPCVFEYVGTFDKNSGLASYDLNDKQKGLLTNDGEFLFGTLYLETIELGFNLFRVKKNEKWGVVTRKGKVIVPVSYSNIRLTGGIIIAQSGNVTDKFDIAGNRIAF